MAIVKRKRLTPRGFVLGTHEYIEYDEEVDGEPALAPADGELPEGEAHDGEGELPEVGGPFARFLGRGPK